MARKNRNNQEFSQIKLEIKEKQEMSYNTALYARLSVEDNGIDADSIENQVFYLKQYINEKKDLKLIKIYSDNGMTGTNFDRPAFTNMIKDVKEGKINCIVVKDLSRFGRNYMETGNYLENVFPYIGVRFISVNDNYDSIAVTANEKLGLAFKNIYHHIYSKDISRKICTSFDVKKKNGFFLSNYAPYGYRKSKENRYKLEVEEETAKTVKEIFDLRLNGLGVVKIARILNDRGIPSQCCRLYEMGKLKRGKNSVWSGSSVLGILENPIYCGCLVERKIDTAYYKGGQKKLIPKENWNYIKNTHEAIIDKETFKKVYLLIEESKKKGTLVKHKERERTENIFKGLIVCGKCGRTMQRDEGYYSQEGKLMKHYFLCPKKYIKKDGCTASPIEEEKLAVIIFEALNKQLSLLTGRRKLLEDYYKQKCISECEIDKQIKEKRIAIGEAENKISTCYQDYRRGLLEKKEYIYAQEKYERNKADLKRTIEVLEGYKAKRKSNKYNKYIDNILKYINIDDLNRELCLTLIDKMVIYDDKIDIHFSFKSEFEQISKYLGEEGERNYS